MAVKVQELGRTQLIVASPLAPAKVTEIVVVDEDGEVQPRSEWFDHPDWQTLPEWAMSFEDHRSTIQRSAVYRCISCGGEHEEFRQNPRDLPYAKVCGCAKEKKGGRLETCTAPALRRVTFPGEGVALNAKRFEELVIYERMNYDKLPAQQKRSLQRFFIPGRNNEPTEPGMRRIEITNINDYNKVIKGINRYETEKMRDHRSMHEEYWKARRKAMRDDVNARIGPVRSHPLVAFLRRAMRARSDAKFNARYGKPLDAHFHAQLIEFEQGKIQDWCSEDSGGRKGWQSRRAR